MRHILTHSGQRVDRDTGTPNIADIALGLSRQPRFGGQGRTDDWSVLDHSMFVYALACQQAIWHGGKPKDCYRLQLHALLHDAHESFMADVPTPFKTIAQRALQHRVDIRLFAALVPEDVDMWLHDVEDIVKLDMRALLAEAMVVGPPHLQNEADVLEHFGQKPYENDVAKLAEFIGRRVGRTREAKCAYFVATYECLRRRLQEPERKTALQNTLAIMPKITRENVEALPL